MTQIQKKKKATAKFDNGRWSLLSFFGLLDNGYHWLERYWGLGQLERLCRDVCVPKVRNECAKLDFGTWNLHCWSSVVIDEQNLANFNCTVFAVKGLLCIVCAPHTWEELCMWCVGFTLSEKATPKTIHHRWKSTMYRYNTFGKVMHVKYSWSKVWMCRYRQLIDLLLNVVLIKSLSIKIRQSRWFSR